MKGTFFEMARIKITHSINHNGRDYVEKVVNQTLLGNCMYFNERNISSYSSGKYHDDQYGNYLLLNTFDKDPILNGFETVRILGQIRSLQSQPKIHM